MNVKRIALIAGLTAGLLLTTGCSQLIMLRRDGLNDPNQFARDNYNCQMDARAATQGGGSRTTVIVGGYGRRGAAIAAGTAGAAVGAAIGEAIAEVAEQRRVYLMCMDAAGYRQATDAEREAAQHPQEPAQPAQVPNDETEQKRQQMIERAQTVPMPPPPPPTVPAAGQEGK